MKIGWPRKAPENNKPTKTKQKPSSSAAGPATASNPEAGPATTPSPAAGPATASSSAAGPVRRRAPQRDS